MISCGALVGGVGTDTRFEIRLMSTQSVNVLHVCACVEVCVESARSTNAVPAGCVCSMGIQNGGIVLVDLLFRAGLRQTPACKVQATCKLLSLGIRSWQTGKMRNTWLPPPNMLPAVSSRTFTPTYQNVRPTTDPYPLTTMDHNEMHDVLRHLILR
jgi:hypothetical protein